MGRRALVATVIAMAIGSVSCRNSGFHEVKLALDAMQRLKTFRMVVNSNSASTTAEFVCPDSVHEVAKGGNWLERIMTPNKVFIRSAADSGWTEESAQERQPSIQIPICQRIFMDAAGGAFGMAAAMVSERSREFKYMGRENVGGQTCDSWGIPVENYEVPRAGQYHDPAPHWASVVCIEVVSHRILQAKRDDDRVIRFYDFDQNITIQAPQAVDVKERTENSLRQD
jgi:hypothetical protein